MATNNIAARLLSDLKRDFGLTDAQAAGVVGNLMYESGGFNSLQEIQPTVPGSRGGYGYAQWTGPRRNAFESYAKSNNLDPSSYEANYGFLKHEIETDPYERRQFNTVKKAKTAEEAARIVSDNFLRPGIPNVPARQQLAAQAMGYSNMPIPPAEIPNVVASRMDVTPQTRDVPLPRPRPAMGGDPGGGGLGTLIPREAAMPPLPRPRPSMGSDPGGGGVGTLVARIDPNTGQAVSVRDVPLPRPRPIMGGDPGGGGIGELVATIPSTQPLPPQRLPDLPLSTMGRDPSSGQVVSPPIMSKAMVEGATGFRLPQTPPLALAVDPLTEYYNLRGNPDMPKKVPGPSINYTKDQSRLAPGWGSAPTQTAATARAAPIMVGMAQQQPVRLPVATAAPQRIAPIPAPLSQRPLPMMAQQPAPVRLAQGQQAPLQVTVQGANSYNGGGQTVQGSATGQRYNTGQSYQSAGYNYQFNNDGSVTNTDTGITRGGGRRSYDPDTNTWQ